MRVACILCEVRFASFSRQPGPMGAGYYCCRSRCAAETNPFVFACLPHKKDPHCVMGQGMGVGAVVGLSASMLSVPMDLSFAKHLSVVGAGTLAGLSVDFVSDCTAKVGKPIIHRDVVLNATDILRHVSTFYAPCDSVPVSRWMRQKHEWLILESHTHKYYVVQKDPATGNLLMDVRMSPRTANDLGLAVAGRPTHTGEIRQHRADQEFDLPNDLQVAYVIAWLRKEDPRWSFSTENSRHFTTKLRSALNDF